MFKKSNAQTISEYPLISLAKEKLEEDPIITKRSFVISAEHHVDCNCNSIMQILSGRYCISFHHVNPLVSVMIMVSKARIFLNKYYDYIYNYPYNYTSFET